MMQVSVEGGQKFVLEAADLQNLDVVKTGDNHWHVVKDGRSYNVHLIAFNREEKKITLRINNTEIETTVRTATDVLLEKLGINDSSKSKVNVVKAPMPGLVLSIAAKEGNTVNKGDTLLVLEAMKMENVIKAPANGTVKKISVAVKQAVEKGQALVEFE